MKLPRASRFAWFGAFAVAIIAVILRPGATSIGPVLAEVTQSLGLTAATAGALTALPGFCFAVAGATAVTLSNKLGTAGTLTLGAAAAALGLLARSLVSDQASFLALSVLALLGAGMGNILVPVFIKRFYPNRQSVLMMVYVVGLTTGATVPGLVTPVLVATQGGWRTALGVWGALSALTVVPWVLLMISERRRAGAAMGPRSSIGSVIRSRRALGLAVFFGIQSMQAYVTFGWLAQILRDAGVSASHASLLLSYNSALGFPAALIMPLVVARSRDLRPYVVAFSVLLAAGFIGLWAAPLWSPILWVTLIAVAGFSFPMALALITARTRDPHVTGGLSGLTQSVGYIFSGLGPLLVGILHQATGGWSVPLLMIAGSSVLLLLGGLTIAKPGYVDHDLAVRP
ncbi:MAG: MFS transporter [Actinobacteria bacterium]|nr:MFS transporter [Actinomycetota bacterium]